MKKAKIGILLSVLLVMITVATCFAPVHVSADEHTYARASEKIQVYTQWDVEAYGDYNNKWLNTSGCGWFAACHSLQWLGLIRNECENKNSVIGKLYQKSNYLNSYENLRGVLNFLKDEFPGLSYTRYESNIGNIVSRSLSANQVAILGGCGHIVAAVEITDDERYVHIVDSCVAPSCAPFPRQKETIGGWTALTYNSNNHFYLFNNSTNQFYEVSKKDCWVRNDLQWYCNTSYEMINSSKYACAGGDYWIPISMLNDNSNWKYTYVLSYSGIQSTEYTYVSLNPGAYYLINRSNGKYLNADGNNSTANISVADYKGRAVQCFMLDGANKSYVISASFTEGLNLNPYSNNVVSGTNVNLFEVETENDQHWGFEAVDSGDNNNTCYYKIHNMRYQNLVLGIQDSGTNVQLETAANADDQLWELVPAYDYVEIPVGSFYLCNKGKGTYLTAEGVSSEAAVKLAALAGSAGQQFVVEKLDQMYAIAVKSNTDLRLNPASDKLAGNIKINLLSSKRELNYDKHWYFEEVSGGYIIHNAKLQGLVLGVDADGKARVEHYSGSGTQTWVLYPLSYIVSYNANGGSGAPAYQTKQHGVSLTLSSTKPVKQYTVTLNANGGNASDTSKTFSATFKNWNTAKAGTGTSYSAGAAYTANADATLYAQWTNPTVGSQLPSPTRSGYNFVGWFTEDGKTKITSSTVITSDTTFVAKWEEIPKYYIDLNGYLDATVSDSLKLNNVIFGTVDIYVDGVLVADDVTDYYTAFPAGSKYEIKDIKATTGHTHNGVRKGKLSGTVDSSLTDLVLVFDTIKYTVSYDANGGSGAPASQTKKHGDTLTLSSTKPSRSGYIFAGWSKDKNATSPTYASGAQYTANENATLYAVWNTVTVTSVSIDKKPTKTEYWVGEALEPAGLQLKVTYSDGTTKTVSSGYSIDGFSSSSAGTKTVTVTYVNASTSFTVTVKEITLKSIRIDSAPDKSEYWIGEALDTKGLTLIATYSNGSEKTITSGFKTSGFSSASAGKKTVTVTLEDKSATFTVTVKEKIAEVTTAAETTASAPEITTAPQQTDPETSVTVAPPEITTANPPETSSEVITAAETTATPPETSSEVITTPETTANPPETSGEVITTAETTATPSETSSVDITTVESTVNPQETGSTDVTTVPETTSGDNKDNGNRNLPVIIASAAAAVFAISFVTVLVLLIKKKR